MLARRRSPQPTPWSSAISNVREIPPIWITGLATVAAAVALIVGAEAGPKGASLFFGLWRTRVLLIVLLLMWLAAGALASRRSRSSLMAFLFGSVLAASTIGLVEVSGQLANLRFGEAMGNALRQPMWSADRAIQDAEEEVFARYNRDSDVGPDEETTDWLLSDAQIQEQLFSLSMIVK